MCSVDLISTLYITSKDSIDNFFITICLNNFCLLSGIHNSERLKEVTVFLSVPYHRLFYCGERCLVGSSTFCRTWLIAFAPSGAEGSCGLIDK